MYASPSDYMSRDQWFAAAMVQSARATGYCCATAYAGGDCGCGGPWTPEEPEPAYEIDPVDGRPLPPPA